MQIFEYQDADHLAADVLLELKISSPLIVGITGASSVGKSTVASWLSRKIECSNTCTIVKFDDFLFQKYRGNSTYYKNVNRLSPQNYNVDRLMQILERLKHRDSVTYKGYERGYGWRENRSALSSDVVLIEGLFLDEVNISNTINFDLLVRCVAPLDIIRTRRAKRDEMLSQVHKKFRTIEESIQETENTIASFHNYKKTKKVRFLNVK